MRVYAYLDGLTTPRFFELPLAFFFIEDARFPARLLIAFPPQSLICSGSTQVLMTLLDMQRSSLYSTQPILRVEVIRPAMWPPCGQAQRQVHCQRDANAAQSLRTDRSCTTYQYCCDKTYITRQTFEARQRTCRRETQPLSRAVSFADMPPKARADTRRPTMSEASIMHQSGQYVSFLPAADANDAAGTASASPDVTASH